MQRDGRLAECLTVGLDDGDAEFPELPGQHPLGSLDRLGRQVVDDLRADSLDIVDLTIAIEEAFSEDAEFEIRDEDAENIHTVQDILDFLAGQGLS